MLPSPSWKSRGETGQRTGDVVRPRALERRRVSDKNLKMVTKNRSAMMTNEQIDKNLSGHQCLQ